MSCVVAHELSGFMIPLDKQGGGHETDKIATDPDPLRLFIGKKAWHTYFQSPLLFVKIRDL